MAAAKRFEFLNHCLCCSVLCRECCADPHAPRPDKATAKEGSASAGHAGSRQRSFAAYGAHVHAEKMKRMRAAAVEP